MEKTKVLFVDDDIALGQVVILALTGFGPMLRSIALNAGRGFRVWFRKCSPDIMCWM